MKSGEEDREKVSECQIKRFRLSQYGKQEARRIGTGISVVKIILRKESPCK
jgi:hypothetical protein